jgi:hypothetical protein
VNRIGKRIPAVAVKELEGGKYEIDFGTALTGWLRMKMPALKAGSVVRMTFADALPGESRKGCMSSVATGLPTVELQQPLLTFRR